MNAITTGPMRPKRDFLSLHDCTPDELRRIVARAIEMKALHRAGNLGPLLAGKSLVMIFQLQSTRTRVGFEAGIGQLGGHAIVLNPADTQLGRGEPIEDTARVMSEMVDAVVIRTRPHEDIVRFANASRIPVINAMTGLLHPCQLLADVQTFEELRGPIAADASPSSATATTSATHTWKRRPSGVSSFGWHARPASSPRRNALPRRRTPG